MKLIFMSVKALSNKRPLTEWLYKQGMYGCMGRRVEAIPCYNLRRSGSPDGTKRDTVTNEIHRRLKNASRELETVRINKILKSYMDDIELSGYSFQRSEEIHVAALKGYKKI